MMILQPSNIIQFPDFHSDDIFKVYYMQKKHLRDTNNQYLKNLFLV